MMPKSNEEKYVSGFYINASIENVWKIMRDFVILNEVLSAMKKICKNEKEQSLVFISEGSNSFEKGNKFIFIYNPDYKFEIEVIDIIETDYFCEILWKFYQIQNNSIIPLLYCRSTVTYISESKSFAERKYQTCTKIPEFENFYEIMLLEVYRNILCQNLISKYANTHFYNTFNYRSFEYNCEYELESKLISNPKLWLGLFETEAKYKVDNTINSQSFYAKITHNSIPKFINNVIVRVKSYYYSNNVSFAKVEIRPISNKDNFIPLDRIITFGLLKRAEKCLFFIQHVFSNFINKDQRKILNQNIDLVNKKFAEVTEFFKNKNKK